MMQPGQSVSILGYRESWWFGAGSFTVYASSARVVSDGGDVVFVSLDGSVCEVKRDRVVEVGGQGDVGRAMLDLAMRLRSIYPGLRHLFIDVPSRI